VTIRRRDGYLEVLAPATSSDDELKPIIAKLVRRLERRAARKTLTDDDLERRAIALNQRHFAGTLRWQSIVWVTNQEQRWGSCTPSQGTLRLSHKLAQLPGWVLDYVIVHELAHLVVPAHDRRFWALVNRYPLTERARGYLIALAGEHGEDAM
jgi:predicted metal-dependent hydrolase